MHHKSLDFEICHISKVDLLFVIFRLVLHYCLQSTGQLKTYKQIHLDYVLCLNIA